MSTKAGRRNHPRRWLLRESEIIEQIFRGRVLRWTLVLLSSTIGVPGVMAGEWWDVDISVEAKLPLGIIPKFSVTLLTPKCDHCEIEVDQGPYFSSFWIRVRSFQDSAKKPKALSLSISAQGFLPYTLNTGLLKYDKYGSASVDNLEFTPARDDSQLPSIIRLTKVVDVAPGTETLEIAVANPTETHYGF